MKVAAIALAVALLLLELLAGHASVALSNVTAFEEVSRRAWAGWKPWSGPG